MASWRKMMAMAGPIQMRAKDLRVDLEDVEDSPGLVRAFKKWARRRDIYGVAIQALEALEKTAERDHVMQRTVQLLVTKLGGPSIDWRKQKARKDGEDNDT